MLNSTLNTNGSVNVNDKAMSSAINDSELQFQRNMDGGSPEQLYRITGRQGANGDTCNPSWRNGRYKPAHCINRQQRIKSGSLIKIKS